MLMIFWIWFAEEWRNVWEELGLSEIHHVKVGGCALSNIYLKAHPPSFT